jgi:hypothetical protein
MEMINALVIMTSDTFNVVERLGGVIYLWI